MLNKIFSFLFLFYIGVCFGQAHYTIEEAERTSDIKVIAAFIKDNPSHPKIPALKRKMVSIMGGNISEPTVKTQPMATSKSKNTSNKSYNNSENKRVADLLTHMFSNDPNRKEAYISLINDSKCRIEITLSGKKTYKVDIAPRNKNFILLDKGSYILTTSICGIPYSANKNISKDIEITLHN